ncbi:OB-fold nucleic acid binding domain-containing protein [Promicromonospora iranensis]|uniref:DNA/RNA endonuclease YhcR with UshA esterase domain n=1 Tax=Promicromonospora iranensis TaxID=1105144 RepID=A0ABU2CV11_9MICO|nr:OB-fold nucleic acid binding domain-containing protein [Promicromonospora iranensis]MDR7385185.1 DNA/RNA endonuclease YhcR with UshA esterase domain [Promicromonospora iranensis]
MSLRSSLASRIAESLASDEEVRDTEERADASRNVGCMAVASVPVRSRGKVAGVLRSVVLRPREGVPTVEAELFDGSGALDLVWLGRRTIDGVEPGRRIRVEGMVCDVDGRRTMFNPRYELRPRPGE